MNKKQQLYDAISYLLTIYENPDEDPWDSSLDDFLGDFYFILCEVQRNWEEITNAE